MHCFYIEYFSNSVLTNLYHCMFQRVLQGAQPATHRQNAQVVKMASTKLTTLAQVNGPITTNVKKQPLPCKDGVKYICI